MAYLIYFIGYVIATNMIVFVMDDDWETDGVTIGYWLACSVFGLLSWALVISIVLAFIVVVLTSKLHSINILNTYLIKPKK